MHIPTLSSDSETASIVSSTSSSTAASFSSLASSATATSTFSDSLSIRLSADAGTKQVLVSVQPPNKPLSATGKDDGKRAPLDICCVIDVSGSMYTEAKIPADPATGAPAESTGLNVLDVVKHALRTIISTMQPDDRIALVTFSDKAKKVAGLTEMSQDGRKKVLDSIEKLVPSGCTNLWDGLKMGMDLLLDNQPPSNTEPVKAISSKFSVRRVGKKEKKVKGGEGVTSLGRLSTIFILTDGMPNIVPPRGHIPMLKNYLDSHDNSHSFSISSFGFGYSLDSPLLLDIARVGGGGYGFIPDSGMVGTGFVHAVSNAYATYAPRAKIDVEVPESANVDVKGGFPFTKTSWGVQIEAGDLQYGQSLDLVLGMTEVPHDINATLTYKPYTSTQDCKVHATLSGDIDLSPIHYHAARLNFVDILFSVKMPGFEKAVNELKALDANIRNSTVLANYPDAMELAKDVSGEGILALEAANYPRWGRHYLPSLARSHQRQQCGNFKDPGLQVYGRDSSVFSQERDKLDAAFMALPPPTPSVRQSDAGGPFGSAPMPTSAVRSMSRYYSSSGPCFAGECLVKLSDGRDVRVDELKRGMLVRTLEGQGRVATVVRTAIPRGETLLCRIADLRVTPWHPIFVEREGTSEWMFPASAVEPEPMACDAVYSVQLDKADNEAAHSVSISGVWCVTLGHGLTAPESGDVRAHVFLGDYAKVLANLAQLEGFYGEDGVVECVGILRDPVDGRMCGFVGDKVASLNALVSEQRMCIKV